MTCREAENLVMPYISNELTDGKLELFLEHIGSCSNCREELEIYFTVDVGIRQLDGETGTYNIKGALETALELSRLRIQKARIVSIIRYTVSTLCVMGVLVTFLLQCRIWWQNGIF